MDLPAAAQGSAAGTASGGVAGDAADIIVAAGASVAAGTTVGFNGVTAEGAAAAREGGGGGMAAGAATIGSGAARFGCRRYRARWGPPGVLRHEGLQRVKRRHVRAAAEHALEIGPGVHR